MALVFIVLSIFFCIITLNVWRDQNYIGLKSNLIAVTFGFTAFNAILALLLLFNALESNPDNLIGELIQHPATLSTLILSLANGVFYGVFTVLFLTSSSQPNKRT